jgi:hypothetical protein
MQDLFDVFRKNADNSLVWIGSADSMHGACQLVSLKAVEPKEQFIVYSVVTNDKIHLRAEDCSPKLKD